MKSSLSPKRKASHVRSQRGSWLPSELQKQEESDQGADDEGDWVGAPAGTEERAADGTDPDPVSKTLRNKQMHVQLPPFFGSAFTVFAFASFATFFASRRSSRSSDRLYRPKCIAFGFSLT